MPRTIRSIGTPAWDASYSAEMMSGSTSAFILAMMRAGRPARAWAISRRIISRNRVAHAPRSDDQLAIARG